MQRKPPENLVAYECVLAGKLLHHRSTRADNEEALRMLERAIALDPGYAHAHALEGLRARTIDRHWLVCQRRGHSAR